MNFSVPNIILGLIGLALGIWITYSAYNINHHILFAGWVERKFGPGTGTIFYQLLGLAIALFSILVMIGIVDLFGAAFGTSGRSSNQNNQNLVPSNGGNQRKIAD
jgi:hypothetical protein